MESDGGEEEGFSGYRIPVGAKSGTLSIVMKDSVEIKIMSFLSFKIRNKETERFKETGPVVIFISEVIKVKITIALEYTDESDDAMKIANVIFETVMFHGISEHTGVEDMIIEIVEKIHVNLSYHGIVGFYDTKEHPESEE